MNRRRILLGVIVVAALIVFSIAGVLYVRRSRLLEGVFVSRAPLPVLPAEDDFRVDIGSGTISVGDFVDYLREATGCEVLASTDVLLRRITVATPMVDVDPEVVRALLEANGLRVDPETIPGGRVVILVTESDD